MLHETLTHPTDGRPPITKRDAAPTAVVEARDYFPDDYFPDSEDFPTSGDVKRDAALVPIAKASAYDKNQIGKLANGPNGVVPNDLPEVTVAPVPSREVKREAEPQTTGIGKREAQRFKATLTTKNRAREAEPTEGPRPPPNH